MTQTSIRLTNTLEAMSPAIASFEEFLESAEAPFKVIQTSSLALEEFITNIVKYGYDDHGQHEIILEGQLDQDTLTIRLIDSGHPFDPLQAAEPDTEASMEDREIGGLGIMLVRKLARSLTYARQDNRNVVEIVLSLQ